MGSATLDARMDATEGATEEATEEAEEEGEEEAAVVASGGARNRKKSRMTTMATRFHSDGTLKVCPAGEKRVLLWPASRPNQPYTHSPQAS